MVNPREKVTVFLLTAVGMLTLLSNSKPSPTNSIPRITIQTSSSSPRQFSHPPTGIRIPDSYSVLADVTDGPTMDATTTTPLFWHPSRSGGYTITALLGHCLDLTIAASGVYSPPTLTHIVKNGIRYVQVGVQNSDSIASAQRLRLLETKAADVIVTHRLEQTLPLFSPEQKGMMFTLMRHPVARVTSEFYYLQTLEESHPKFDPKMEVYGLVDWIRLGNTGYVDNLLTRSLTGKITGELDGGDVDTAKEVLRRKCLVGLLEEKVESWRRFRRYFNWHPRAAQEEECEERPLHWGWYNSHAHPEVEENTELYDEVYAKEWADVELYGYARVLFVEQEVFFDQMRQTQQRKLVTRHLRR